MLVRAATHDDVYSRFSWKVPQHFNIAHAVCERHAGRNRTALIEESGNANRTWTFEDLSAASRRLANVLASFGVSRGSVIAILLPQSAATLIAHLAIYRMGAIALPLFNLFGPDAIEHRVRDSGAGVLITDDEGLIKVDGVRAGLPDLRAIVTTGSVQGAGLFRWDDLMERASDRHEMIETNASDPALLQYTSGTTGKPKGVLHAHHVLLGILPGVELSHDFMPQEGDVVWTPADWAWGGGLLATLLPALLHGLPVVARRLAKFDPELAIDLMVRNGVRNVFFPPTALRMIRQSAAPALLERVRLRSIISGGERLGEEMLAWGKERLGVDISEIYGQTEANLIVCSCASVMSCPSTSMGKPVPGHVVEIVDAEGNPLPAGQRGIVALRVPDPVVFLGYWKQPEATGGKYRNGRLLTGDIGECDEQGYFYFRGRDDDIISSAGYRIGPDEVENCILQHPAVAMAAVIGVPDPLRGEIVKAFVVPATGTEAGPELREAIREFVKQRLSAHEYPREIEFRSTLPLTVTGKIVRAELRKEENSRRAAETG